MLPKIIQALVLISCLLFLGPPQETNAAPSAACVLTWDVVSSPAPANGQYVLNNADAASASDVWAVGHYAPSSGPHTTLIERWNGTAWSLVPSPSVANKYNELKSVSVLAANDAWAVGMATENALSQTLIQHWNGTDWSIVPSPNTVSGYGELYSVDGAAANDVWAVGGWNGATLILHWDGTNWNAVTGPTNGALRRVIALATTDVWVLGQESATQASVLHWNGATWSVHSTIPLEYIPGVYGTVERVYDLSVSNATDMWVVGEKNQLRYQNNAQRRHWDGSSWTVMNPPDDIHAPVEALAGTQTDNLWAVGNDPYIQRAFLSQWDGSAWANYMMQNVFGPGNPQGITAISNDEFWVVGESYTNQTANAALIAHGTLPCQTIPSPIPTLLTPAHTDVLTEIRPSFTWTEVVGAEYYTLRLFQHTPGGDPFLQFDSMFPQFSFENFTPLSDDTYYWDVRACSYPGCGPWSAQREFTIVAAKPVSAPAPLSPADNALLSDTTVPFEWSVVPNTASYNLEIYQGATNGPLVRAQTFVVTNPEVYNLTGTGKFFWHVNACNDGGCSAWSDWRMFVETVPQTPPELKSPKKNAVLDALRPKFEWKPVHNATFYKLELRMDTRKGKVVDTVKPTDTQWRWRTELNGGVYFWRVRACTDLSCGDWSAYRKLTIQRSGP